MNDNAGHLPQTSGAFFRLYSASSQHVLDRPRLRAAHIARASAAEPRDGERSISQSFLGHRISTSRLSVAISPNVLKGSEWSLRQR